MEFTAAVILGLLLLGAVAGVLAGLLGIGGGVIMVPGLTQVFLLSNPLLVKAIVFTTMIFNAVSATARHVRSGYVLPTVVKYLVPLSAAGVAAGYLLTREMPIALFQGIFGVFLLYVVCLNAWRFVRPKGRVEICADEECTLPVRRAFWIGAPMGFIAGVLGIGGGSLAGPGLQVFLRMPLKNAVACSSVAMIPLVLAAAGLSWWDSLAGHTGAAWWVPLAAAGLMAPGALCGAYAGACLTKVMPVRAVRGVFALALFLTALRMLQAALT